MRRLQHLGLALMAIASPAIAQPAPAAAPDPARLGVARDVIALAMPPVVSAAMVDRMVQGFVPVMRQIFLRDPQLQAFYAVDPRVKSIFDRYVSEVQPRTQASIQASTPAVFEAMARAYSRRVTLAQLVELKSFLVTPTGQLFIAQSTTILIDPDLNAAQVALLVRIATATEKDKNAEIAEIKALAALNPKSITP